MVSLFGEVPDELDWLRNTVLGTLEILDGKKSLKFIQYFYDGLTINQSKVPRAAFSVRGIEPEFLEIVPWAHQTELNPEELHPRSRNTLDPDF